MPTQKFWVKTLKAEDEERIARRLRELDGVFHAELNHRDECAEVDFADDRVSLEEIRSAIGDLGYEARIAG